MAVNDWARNGGDLAIRASLLKLEHQTPVGPQSALALQLIAIVIVPRRLDPLDGEVIALELSRLHHAVQTDADIDILAPIVLRHIHRPCGNVGRRITTPDLRLRDELGTYTYNVTNGTTSDTIVVTIGAAPSPIPTLSEWAEIMMMFLMILTVAWYGRRLKQR